jgi:hypothetical protein
MQQPTRHQRHAVELLPLHQVAGDRAHRGACSSPHVTGTGASMGDLVAGLQLSTPWDSRTVSAIAIVAGEVLRYSPP